MSSRLSKADRVAAIAATLGIIVLFLPWYTYTQGQSHVTVNGFRASLLGDAFFVAVAATGLLLAIRAGLVADVLGGRFSPRTAYTAVSAIALLCVLLQLVLVAGGH